MRVRALIGVAALVSAVGCAEAAGQVDSPGLGQKRLRTFAAVYMVRGSVVGRNTGEFGLFAREGTETSWTKILRSNVYAFGLGSYVRGNSARYYLAAGNGVHRSTDRGASWKIITSWQTAEILAIQPDPVDSTILYSATPEGVFKTTDDGKSWVPKRNGFRRWFVPRLALDPEQRSVLYAASEDDLYRTTDGGEHWTASGPGVPQVQAVYVSRATRGLVFCAAEDSGLYVSRDSGRIWKRARGLEGSTIYAITGSADGGEYYAAGWETGVWHSRDGGSSWSVLWKAPGLQAIFVVACDPANPRHLCAGTDGEGVYDSFDGGVTWKRGGMMGAKVKDIAFIP